MIFDPFQMPKMKDVAELLKKRYDNFAVQVCDEVNLSLSCTPSESLSSERSKIKNQTTTNPGNQASEEAAAAQGALRASNPDSVSVFYKNK